MIPLIILGLLFAVFAAFAYIFYLKIQQMKTTASGTEKKSPIITVLSVREMML